MRTPTSTLGALFVMTAVAAATLSGPTAAAPPQAGPSAPADRIARGEYLVRIMSCHDCHTPHKPAPGGGIEPDMTRALSGHPQDMKMPPLPKLPEGPWIGVLGATMTSWGGPWGVSFTANLTPDKETGLGTWTEEMFIATIKSGRHQGKGRPILPPMTGVLNAVRSLTDEDLRAVFAYLQSINPVRNKVPEPIDPAEEER
ncbi:MAG TPA: hypothetical protein VF198_07350 [Vicinamibacterales bacterium]